MGGAACEGVGMVGVEWGGVERRVHLVAVGAPSKGAGALGLVGDRSEGLDGGGVEGECTCGIIEVSTGDVQSEISRGSGGE